MTARRLPHVLAFIVILGTSLTLWAVAGPPAGAGIPYQGRLELGNEPYTGAINMRVQIFSDAARTDDVHTEPFSDVDVRGGAFSVIIGQGTLSDELLRSDELYLALEVGDPLMPLDGLQKLHPTAQAQAVRYTADLVVTPGAFELTNDNASIGLNGADADVTLGAGGTLSVGDGSGEAVVDVAGWVDQQAPHIRLKTTPTRLAARTSRSTGTPSSNRRGTSPSPTTWAAWSSARQASTSSPSPSISST